MLIANVPLAAIWTRKGRSGILVSLEAPIPRRLKGAAMLHSHLTMEERIGIAVFMHMSMSCRKIAAYPGRCHTFIFRVPHTNLCMRGVSGKLPMQWYRLQMKCSAVLNPYALWLTTLALLLSPSTEPLLMGI